MAKGEEDGRRRRVSLTRKGSAERAAYDRLSDNLAASMLGPLDVSEQSRLLAAMGEVERLIRAASVKVAAGIAGQRRRARVPGRVLPRACGAIRERL